MQKANTSSPHTPGKRILALDVGERRIGVAVSDPLGMIARPLMVLTRASRQDDLRAIQALVAEHDVGLVLVGLPLTLRGEHGPQAQQVERYAAQLAEGLSAPIRFWDERFSTSEAQDLVKARKKKPEAIDALAAAVFLQTYLNSQANSAVI